MFVARAFYIMSKTHFRQNFKTLDHHEIYFYQTMDQPTLV